MQNVVDIDSKRSVNVTLFFCPMKLSLFLNMTFLRLSVTLSLGKRIALCLICCLVCFAYVLLCVYWHGSSVEVCKPLDGASQCSYNFLLGFPVSTSQWCLVNGFCNFRENTKIQAFLFCCFNFLSTFNQSVEIKMWKEKLNYSDMISVFTA